MILMFQLLLLLTISTLRRYDGVMALKTELEYSIDEGANLNAFVGNVRTNCGVDNGLSDSQAQSLQFMILASNKPGGALFKVDTKNGHLLVAAPIDYDDLNLCSVEPCFVQLQMTVLPESIGGLIYIKIRIGDVNDNSPMFNALQRTINLSEDQTQFQTMLEKATDRDSGANGQVRHSLFEKSGTFILTEKMDMLFLNLKSGLTLDYESVKLYSATLEACDGGAPTPRCAKQIINIQIADVNDNNPQVLGSPIINLDLREDYSTTQPLVQINASDSDSGENARLMFRIGSEASGMVKTTFRIGRDNGVLFLQQNFDAQQSDSYDIPIIISDNGANPRFAKATVRVRVNDVNNHAPTVILSSAVNSASGNGRIEVMENSAAGQVIAFVVAHDGDLGDNAHLTCDLPSAHAQLFSLTEHGERGATGITYKLKSNVRFDYENQQSIGIEVRCYDNGQPSLNTSSKVTVFILNENEFAPEFRPSNGYNADVIEGKSNEPVLSVVATDNDTNSVVTYALDEMGVEKFSIDATTGTIFTKEELDRESTARYVFNVLAIDNADGSDGKQRTATAQVVVLVLDANDNAPLLLPPHIFNVEEGQPVLSSLRGGLHNQGRLVGQDLDESENGRVGFQLLNVGAAGIAGANFGNSTFTIGLAGQLLTAKVLDREQVASYLLTICVFDYGKLSERKSVTVTVTVNVLDLDDESPVWSFPRLNDNWVNITSEKALGDEVTTVEANDPDSSSNLTYTLLRGSGYFAVQRFTGKVVVSKELRAGQHELYIRVDDNALPLNHHEEARLYINVFGIQSAQHTRDARINLTIIITMVVITTVISVALVAAIVCVRKRSLLPPTESCMTSDIDKGGVVEQSACQCHYPDDMCNFQQTTLPREPVYHQLCTSPHIDRLYPLSTFSTATIDRNYHASSTLKGVGVGGQKSISQLGIGSQGQLTVEIRNNEVLVNNLDLDKESADSGRGASEEGGNLSMMEQRGAAHLINRYPLDTRGISPVPFSATRPSSRASQRISHANMNELNSATNCRCHILPEGEAVQSLGCTCGVCGQESNSILLTGGGQTNFDGYVSTYSRLQQADCQPPAYASLPRHAAVLNAAPQQQYSQMTFARRTCNPQPATLPSSMPMVSFSSTLESKQNDNAMGRVSRANHYVMSPTTPANVSHP